VAGSRSRRQAASLEATDTFYGLRNIFHTYLGIGITCISGKRDCWVRL
jgi:hypothetical protein